MSYGLNVVVIEGRLVAAPELKKTSTGDSVCTIRIAVQKDKESADYFDIVGWKQKAEFICDHFTKGDGIIVTGELKSRTFDSKTPQGNETFKKTVYEIKANDIKFPLLKKNSQGNNECLDTIKNALQSKNVGDFEEYSGDDDLPF